MASLPSFVQLMAALALKDHPDNINTRPRSASSPPRIYSSRYSPYSPCHKRISSSSSTSSADSSPEDQTFRNRTRKFRHKVNRGDPSSDIGGDTPISTYVRRRTPGSSPISSNFDSGYESSASLNHSPFSIPSLPVLLTNPDSPTSDPDDQIGKDHNYYRFILLQRTGTRISAARAARREQIARRYAHKN